MDPKEIRHLLIAHPFRSFTVHMTDGVEYRVTHPERALLSEETLFVYQNQELIRCALINISRIATLEPAEN